MIHSGFCRSSPLLTLSVFMLFVGLLVFNPTAFSEVTVSLQMSQALIVIFGTLGGITFLLGIDRLFKKWMLG